MQGNVLLQKRLIGRMFESNCPIHTRRNSRIKKRKALRLDNTIKRNGIFAPSKHRIVKAHAKEPNRTMTNISMQQQKSKPDTKKRKAIRLDNIIKRNDIFASPKHSIKKAHVMGPNRYGPMKKVAVQQQQKPKVETKKRKAIRLDNTIKRNGIFSSPKHSVKIAQNMEPNRHSPMTKASVQEQRKPKADTTWGSSHSWSRAKQNRGYNAPITKEHGVLAASKFLKSAGRRRDLATIKRRIGCAPGVRSCWTQSETLYSIPIARNRSAWNNHQAPFCHKLRRGGNLKVYPNLLSENELKGLQVEVLGSGFFRQYRVQAQDEPRVHFLLNDQATFDDFETSSQPGYRYAKVKIKSRPLCRLPRLEYVSKELATASGVERWNIGVNPVLYRDSKDGMGGHADDDQGETVILCLVLASPDTARPVVIAPSTKGSKLRDGDERIELVLRAGDAYEMDGDMQKHYLHSIPKRKKDHGSKRRLTVVFRAGDEVLLRKDSGRPCENLSPKARQGQIFGRINELFEGHLYTRLELFNLSAHRMHQRGISGNRKTGADAILVSGRRDDNLEYDDFLSLSYAAERRIGALGLVESYDKSLPIRVFRSSKHRSPHRAVAKCSSTDTPAKYRYDGLYKVVSYSKPLVPKGPFVFNLHRSEAGNDTYSNHFRNTEMSDRCTALGTKNSQDLEKTTEMTSEHDAEGGGFTSDSRFNN